MTRPQLHLVNNHLNLNLFEASTRLTEGEQAILEVLCTDSIYSIKDDFDKGFDDRIWVQDGPVAADTEGIALGELRDLRRRGDSRPTGDDAYEPEARGATERRPLGSGRAFAVLPDYFGGALVATPSQRVALMSRQGGWRPNRRCSLMGRIKVVNIGGSKFEFGFADADSGHISDIDDCVLTKSTPTNQAQRSDYAVIVRDTDHNTSTDLVASTARVAALTAAVGPVTLSAGSWRSYMIALNEQNEARFYLDGIYAGVNRSSARLTTLLSIWFMAVPRAGGAPEVQIDYIQAWQEREPL